MNINMRHEEVNGHSISGSVTIDIETGVFRAEVSRVGGLVNSSFSSPPLKTRADAVTRMEREFDEEVEWAEAH